METKDVTSYSKQVESLLGENLYKVWQDLSSLIEYKYDMDLLWNSGGKKWDVEYKYRRGGKTLCALYAKKQGLGFMVILGKEERRKFEECRKDFSENVQCVYDSSTTYHDGKWIMFEPVDFSMFEDFMRLLAIKRKSNRKG